MYLLITSGWSGEPDMNFITSFWKFYAERYKDKTHVIFEIANDTKVHAEILIVE